MKNIVSLLVMVAVFNFHMVSQAVELEAKLDWADYQTYGFSVNGIVEKVLVNIGDKVKQGDILANLSAKPFKYKIQKCQAALKKFDPQIFDAKLELDQAEELFERTVLSEVELQKIDGKHKVLIEEQNTVRAECLLKKWHKKLSILKAIDSAYVLNLNINKGQVISDENKSAVFIELVSAKKASAIVWTSYTQKSQLNMGKELKIIVDKQEFSAKVTSIAIQPNKENMYKIVAEFYYTKMVEPGKAIKLVY